MLQYFNWKWASFFASISIFIALCKSQNAPEHEEHTENNNFDDLVKVFPTQQTFETHHPRSSVVIVSTLDGKVSALDARNGGHIIWSVDIGQGPLVSSSISKLQVKQDGKMIRLIPSLSGGLFQFDGNSVEAVPFTADHLLSSSFKVTDDSILVGGKDVTTFGLDSSTGKILYFCSPSGCENIEEASPGSDVIIVKRRQQTVRSVENRNGRENWNFTVGEVELDISKGTKYHLLEHSGEGVDEDEDDSHANVHSRPGHNSKDSDSDKHDNREDFSAAFNIMGKMKVLIPEGVFCMFNAAAKKHLSWKYKFDSPIANAWYVSGGEHHKINLFDPRTVPALQEQKANKDSEATNPTIYMGFYKKNVYIQVSTETEHAVSKALAAKPHRSNPYYQMIKFPYRPFLATSDHLTEATVGEAKEGEIAVYSKTNAKGSCGHSLAVYADQQPHTDVGYYFKSDLSYQGSLRESRRRGRTTVEDGGNDSFKDYHIDVVYSSFMHWWKEILIISVTTSIFMQFLIVKFMQLAKKGESEMSKSNSSDYIDAVTDLRPQTSDASTIFESRYLHDFQPIQCLGKGGFGVVFESRNKVDDCSYAVKRIRLPNKQSAREKVMREVRALAKLDHPSIVRYFNAWTEEPPEGWQEKTDQQLLSDVSTYVSRTTSLATSTSVRKEDTKYTNADYGQRQMGEIHSPLQYSDFNLGETGSFSISPTSRANVETAGQTGSFGISFRDSSDQGEGFQMKKQKSSHPHLGKFFQTSSAGSSEEEDTDLNQSVPFSRYKAEESSGVIFEEYSGDSAIVKDAPGKSGEPFTKGHNRNVSECAELPTYEQLYRKAGAGASVVRKRSTSLKPSTDDDDSDTTGSELRDVVCRQSSVENKEKEKSKSRPKRSTSVYLYIQMQLCQKDSLRIWLANNKERDHKYCLWIFHQVISAVEYVHECSLIHRDLKPSNIFFSFDGTVKVGDFGLVTETDDLMLSDGNKNPFESPLIEYVTNDDGTRTERVGTRLYMAPEQMTSRNYSQKVDIFALGIILIELITPFSTQMERIRELTHARACKFGEDFMSRHPVETTLAKKMLSRSASVRPTASEIAAHEVFSEIESMEEFTQQSKGRNRKRTVSKE